MVSDKKSILFFKNSSDDPETLHARFSHQNKKLLSQLQFLMKKCVRDPKNENDQTNIKTQRISILRPPFDASWSHYAPWAVLPSMWLEEQEVRRSPCSQVILRA